MSDYAASTPLWSGGGNLLDLTPLGLPPQLVTSLLAWQRHFDDHFRIDRLPHWDSAASAGYHAQEGAGLHDRLRRALPDVEFSLDLWPVEADAPSG